MEEETGSHLEDKLGDFDEVIPNIAESREGLTHDNEEDRKEIQEKEELVEGEEEEAKDKFSSEPEVEDSPISNGHSIVTEATIEAHDLNETPVLVSIRLP